MFNLLSAIFGCAHSRTTFPMTPARRSQLASGAPRKGAYVVCLDCGKEFEYSWPEMRIGNRIHPEPAALSGGKEEVDIEATA